jgi:hypothetical protein
MGKATMTAILLGAGLATLTASRGSAHHSAAMFDDQTTVEITGTVKEFQYTNPHSWLLIDVKNPDGSVTTWGFEAEGPSTLLRAGIRKSDFSPGTEVTIWGHPMRDGRPAAAWRRAIRVNDGKEFMSRPMSGN